MEGRSEGGKDKCGRPGGTYRSLAIRERPSHLCTGIRESVELGDESLAAGRSEWARSAEPMYSCQRPTLVMQMARAGEALSTELSDALCIGPPGGSQGGAEH
eukprot:154583-Chlamydomonas_euryale.AAC.1